METTDYCSYELSKALKACGFDEPCDHYYHIKNGVPEDDMWFTHGSCADFNNYKRRPDDFVSAPFLWQAQKWLRKVKHISVRVSYIHYHKVWFADWLNLDSGEFDDTDATFATYEEALADGISVALELIEQENK